MTSVYESALTDKELVSLARKIAEEYGDPDQEIHTIPLYRDFIYCAINETAYSIGMSYSDTELFRDGMIDALKQMSKEYLKGQTNDQ
jgi:hypothetical protein